MRETLPAAMTYPFRDTVTSEAGLREIIGEPSELVLRKQLPALDAHCRAFIARSPFVLVGTANRRGMCDVSPRGDAPGFVLVLDDRTLLIPDRPGNRRIDSFRNVLENPHVGLLFVIPGFEETLRVNGRARLVRDADLLAQLAAKSKTPTIALGVEVREAFLHCAKAFKRSALWQSETWPERGVLPSLGAMLQDQVRPEEMTAEQLDCQIEESYVKRLY